MDTSVLMIDNMLAGIAGAVPASPGPDVTKGALQSSPSPADKPYEPDTAETAGTDNTTVELQERPAKEQPKDFGDTLRRTVTTDTAHQAQSSTKAKEKEQDLGDGGASEIGPAKPLLTQESPAFTIPPLENAGTKILVKPNAPANPAHLIVADKATKFTPVSAQSMGFVATRTKPGNPTAGAPKAEGPSAKSTTAASEPKPKAVVSEVPKGPLPADTLLKAGKNRDQAPISNKALIDAKHLAMSASGQKLMAASPAGRSKTTAADPKMAAAGQKQIITGTSVTAGSQKNPVLDGRTTIAAQKMPPPSTGVPAVQNKSAETTPRPVGIGSQESAKPVEKPTDNKAALPELLSESAGGHRKESAEGGNRLSENSTIHKLNVTQVQVSAGETKSHGGSTSNNNAHSNLEHMLSNNVAHTPPVEKSATSAENAKPANTAGQPLPKDVSADIGKQILESIHSSLARQGADRQITVRLNPPELGKVFIKFQERDAQITGLLEVSKTQTRLEIEQALPQIIRNLADSGIQIKRLDVVLSGGGQSEQETLKDQSLQNGGAQQQDAANSGTYGNDPDTGRFNEWPANHSGFGDFTELQEAFITDCSIDMLV